MTSTAPRDHRDGAPRAHPRTLGWVGTTALAMGGSVQSLFLLAALFAGQGDIPGQGSAAVPLLMVGLLLSWAAAPGWTELVLMFPHRVGGIAASCVEAFRPYSAVLANLTGVCYWWGWVPGCGVAALLAASALHEWYLPQLAVTPLAVAIVVALAGLNLAGITWVRRLAVPVASACALLAFASGLGPLLAGTVDWRTATTFHLTTPFTGWFGGLTGLMAGLYLIGFAAPAFEAAACHVGESVEPAKTVPRAMRASALLAGLFFGVLPMVWLGSFGAEPLGRDLALVLGPTFAPLFGGLSKAAAVWFMVFAAFSGAVQPLAGASRVLAQLAEDGLLPRSLARRSRTDAPWVATLWTAGMAIAFLLIGDPLWLIAAANFTYLISITLPSVAVWLLRRDAPSLPRPYRAPRWTIGLGLAAALVWGCSALLGFEQFGLSTVVVGLAFAYSGSLLYGWRRFDDRRRAGLPGFASSLQVKLTGALIAVLVLDAAGYLLAVGNMPEGRNGLMTGLADIFVAVAMLSITVALVLPGMVAHSVSEVSDAARRLATGTLADFSRAMTALGRGDLDGAHASVDITPVRVTSGDEIGDMAASFNLLQAEVGAAAVGLAGAREGLRQARDDLTEANARLEERVVQLHRAEEKLSSVLDSIDNVVWSLSVAGHRLLLYINPAAERVLGWPVAQLMAEPTLWLRIIHPDDLERARSAFDGLRKDEVLTLEYRIVWPDGSIRWIEDRARMICDAQGAPLRIDGVGTDITERKMHAERMAHQASHDALTGLPNRTLLGERLTQALTQARRDGRHVAVLFLDLDGFKFVNDSRGHAFGDSLLRSVAARLSALVRETDTVARLGGDEFVILLPHLLRPEDAEHVAAKVLEAFAAKMYADGREVHLSASIGLSVFPRDGDSGELLLQHADTAMYRAKAKGRNRCESYSEDMGVQAQQRMELEIELRLALEREQLSLHYQPQIDSASGRTVGVEALLRWSHPTLGMVPPSKFIPLAEDTGLIIPISEWVLRSACAQARVWHRAGHELVVAVNLSARHFQQRDIPTLVREVLATSGLPARFLELELTESALIHDTEAAVHSLRDIKALGVRLALDDFGTGYSSLSYLKRFPIDVLKIDQSFTFDVTQDEGAASITRAIIAMARSLKMTTIAEGVETPQQRELLVGWGCDMLQGYHISRPLPVAALTPWLQAQREVAAVPPA